MSSRILLRLVVYGVLVIALAITLLSVWGRRKQLSQGEIVPWFDGCFAQLHDNVRAACEKADKGRPLLKEMVIVKLRTDRLKRLESLVESDFRKTERRLVQCGLSDEYLSKHHSYVNRFRENMVDLASRSRALTRHYLKSLIFRKETGAVRSELKEFMRFLEEREPREAGVLLDVNSLPHRSAPVVQARMEEISGTPVPRQGIGSSGPRAGDCLGEAEEVRFTDDIRELALSLGNSPYDISNYVREHFDYVPYYGSLKGAQETLRERAGNDLDLASLLIALLRVSGIPARYVHGETFLTPEQAMAWVGGVDDPRTAGRILSTCRIPCVCLVHGDSIVGFRIDHYWVEAFLTQGQGSRSGKREWVTFDPGYKEYGYYRALEVSRYMAFDETGYLSYPADSRQSGLRDMLRSFFGVLDPYEMSPLDFYLRQADSAFGAVDPDMPLLRSVGGAHIIGRADTSSLESLTALSRHSGVPGSLRYGITFRVTDLDGQPQLSCQMSTYDIADKSVLLHYAPSTEQDSSVVEKCGGLTYTPPYLFEVEPLLCINTEVVASGGPVEPGESQFFRIGLVYPPGSEMDTVVTEVIAGEWQGAAFELQRVPDDAITKVGDALIPILEDIDMKVADAEIVPPERRWIEPLFYEMGLFYLSQIDLADRLLRFFLHLTNSREPSIAMVTYGVTVSSLFGRPYSLELGSISLDGKRIVNRPFSVSGHPEAERIYNLVSGYESSFHMHRTLEFFGMGSAISAVKALQIAHREEIPVVHLDSTNADRLLRSMPLPDELKEKIGEAIAARKVVRISEREITFSQWRGVGYMVIDPVIGDGGYRLYGTHQSVYLPKGRSLVIGLFVTSLVLAVVAVVWTRWLTSRRRRRA